MSCYGLKMDNRKKLNRYIQSSGHVIDVFELKIPTGTLKTFNTFMLWPLQEMFETKFPNYHISSGCDIGAQLLCKDKLSLTYTLFFPLSLIKKLKGPVKKDFAGRYCIKVVEFKK